jgi:hypothetical protein
MQSRPKEVPREDSDSLPEKMGDEDGLRHPGNGNLERSSTSFRLPCGISNQYISYSSPVISP